MTAELINTGSELLLGRILNTHLQWLGRRLADAGYELGRQVTVPDTGEAIEAAIREALSRADIVITTGGLGPTGDDLTRERVAGLLGRKLLPNPEVAARIRHFFESRGRPTPPRTSVESLVPEGATVLPNNHGTAPGLAVKLDPNPFRNPGKPALLVLLPGPPRELHPMFRDQALPLLLREMAPDSPCHSLTLRTTGIGESNLEDLLAPPLAGLLAQGLQLGFCAKIAEVEVRFTGRGSAGRDQISAAEAIALPLLGDAVFGQGDELLEAAVIREATRSGCTVALAESCTGGFIAHRLTNVPGASVVLLAGVVSYANAAKQDFLGVSGETLVEFGAVSEPVARQMAVGVRRAAKADFGLAVTGIAGPGGGSAAKPVGTAFIGLAGPDGAEVVRQLNPFDRETFKFATAQQALDLLRRRLRQLPSR
jgi:nicotinamide-nucleotide amidase